MSDKLYLIKIKALFISLFTFLITSCGSNDPQADICGSYNKWNWYLHNARNADNYDEEASWLNLAENEFSKLGESSRKWNGLIDSQLDESLKLWQAAGYSGDTDTGVAMASVLFVRCEDLGYKMDLEALN